MASSRKSTPNKAAGIEATIAAALEPILFPKARLALALSGGVDSVVLLRALHKLARPLGFVLSCLHVNHNISPNARDWAAFCARLCRRYRIALQTHAVDIGPYRSEGLEAAARRARYQAFAACADADFIVLAQHLDDQAETMLLQLLRGAGVKGGASMPLLRQQGKGRRGDKQERPAILRPMLGLSRKEIVAYARANKLAWVEDESNDDTRRERNFLRHRVLPVLEQGFPAYRTTLARAARNLAEASAVLDELAQADARRAVRGGSIALAAMRSMGEVRAKNLLRWLLQCQGAMAPEADRLQEGLRQIFEAGDDALVHVPLGGVELRRFAGRAYLLPPLPQPPAEFRFDWDGSRTWPLPDLGGELSFRRSKGKGLSVTRVADPGLSVCLRQGGERMRLHSNGPSRSLKNLLQEARLPPWERERLPLVYCAGTLVAVPGVGVASGWEAGEGEYGWSVSWRRPG